MAHPTPVSLTANTGAQIFQIPMVVFPNGFVAYCYLILSQGEPTLVDCGRGLWRERRKHLLTGIEAVRADFGEAH